MKLSKIAPIRFAFHANLSMLEQIAQHWNHRTNYAETKTSANKK